MIIVRLPLPVLSVVVAVRLSLRLTRLVIALTMRVVVATVRTARRSF